MRRIAAAAVVVFTPILSAAYSNLIATADGATVYFQTVGFGSEKWFALGAGSSGPSIVPVNTPLADVSASGTVLASALVAERYCGFAGSSCFVRAQCAANFSIEGPGIQTAIPNGVLSFVWIGAVSLPGSNRTCRALALGHLLCLRGWTACMNPHLCGELGPQTELSWRTGAMGAA